MNGQMCAYGCGREPSEDNGEREFEMYQLVKADLDGRVIVMPCKVGDIVYKDNKTWSSITGAQPFQITNIMISQNKKGVWKKQYRAMWLYNGKTVDSQINFFFEDIGVNVFLTLGEAVRASELAESNYGRDDQ